MAVVDHDSSVPLPSDLGCDARHHAFARAEQLVGNRWTICRDRILACVAEDAHTLRIPPVVPGFKWFMLHCRPLSSETLAMFLGGHPIGRRPPGRRLALV